MTSSPRRAAAAVLAVLALVAASLVARAGGNPQGGKFDPAKPAPAFLVQHALKTTPTKNPLADLRGRVVLLTIVETYNEKCAAAAPRLQQISDKFGPAGLTVLLVAHEEEPKAVEAWMAANGLRTAAVIVDTPQWEKVQRGYPAAGYPWSFLIDAGGTMHLHAHPQDPQGWADHVIAPFLDATTRPPLLPEALADAQAHLDGGRWAAARTALLAAADGGKLSKADVGWAKGVAAWIEKRRARTLAEGEALEAKAWWWDAWALYDDFTRRYEGMPDVDAAKSRADAVRERGNTDAAVKGDLVLGDDVQKARDYLAAGKPVPARLICERISKLKNTRFADRARDLLATIPKK